MMPRMEAFLRQDMGSREPLVNAIAQLHGLFNNAATGGKSQ